MQGLIEARQELGVVKKVLIRVDGSHSIGMGHLVRMSALANRLSNQYAIEVGFAVMLDKLAESYLRSHTNSKAYIYREDTLHKQVPSEREWLHKICVDNQFGILVCDIRTDLSREDIGNIRSSGIKVVLIDDLSDRRLEADLSFYPDIPQVHSLDWSECKGETLVGSNWYILREVIDRARKKAVIRLLSATDEEPEESDRLKVYVCMGGSDPHNLFQIAMKCLEVVAKKIQVTLVIGPGFNSFSLLKRALDTTALSVDVRYSPENIEALICEADLGFVSFGVSAYECAALGLPVFLVSLTEDHERSAQAMVEKGCALSLGIASELEIVKCQREIDRLVTCRHHIAEMSKNCFMAYSTEGLANVAHKIYELGQAITKSSRYS